MIFPDDNISLQKVQKSKTAAYMYLYIFTDLICVQEKVLFFIRVFSCKNAVKWYWSQQNYLEHHDAIRASLYRFQMQNHLWRKLLRSELYRKMIHFRIMSLILLNCKDQLCRFLVRAFLKLLSESKDYLILVEKLLTVILSMQNLNNN